MSEKIQAIIPDKLATEIKEIIEKEKHENTSEFVRFALQEYVLLKRYGLVKAPGGN